MSVRTIQIESETGSDGVLALTVPLGAAGANTRVRITIEPLDTNVEDKDIDWPTIVDQTYGSCAGLGLEEPEDLPPEERDWAQ
jgi:hypothetical protein